MQSKKDEENKADIHVSTNSMDAGRDIVISKGDVTTGSSGDIQSGRKQIVIGGVPTDQDQLNQLIQAFTKLERVIAESDLGEDDKEAALDEAKRLKAQMTTPSAKANSTIIAAAGEAVYKYGPAITGALVAAFTTPLGGLVATAAGAKALEFYRKLKETYPDEKFAV